MTAWEKLKTIGAVALVIVAYNGITAEQKKIGAENKIAREIENKAKINRATQIDKANDVAKVLIANATGEKKACLEMPGIKIGYAMSNGEQPYRKAEACHLGTLPKVEGLYTIKKRLES